MEFTAVVIGTFILAFWWGRSGRTKEIAEMQKVKSDEIKYLRTSNTELQKKFMAKNMGEWAAFGDHSQDNAKGLTKFPRSDEVEYEIEQRRLRGKA